MKRCEEITVIVAVALLSMMVMSTAKAETPQVISYQGQLTDALGAPLDTTVSMTFALYDDSTDGSVLWAETQPAVTVAGGMFSVLLGSVNPVYDTVFSDPERYLGIQVGLDPEMAPRTQLAAVPGSYRVSTIDGASGGIIKGCFGITGDETAARAPAVFHIGGTNPGGTPYWIDNPGSAPWPGFLSIYDGSSSTPTIQFDGGAGKAYIGSGCTNPGAHSIALGQQAHAIGDNSFIWNDGFSGPYSAIGNNSFVIHAMGGVGIGTNTPSGALEVAGTVRMAGFEMPSGAVNGYVLTCNSVPAGHAIWAPVGSAVSDGDWELGTVPNGDVLFTVGNWGIARNGATLLGNNDFTHVNLGVNSTTGDATHSQYSTVSGGHGNVAAGEAATIGGGEWNRVETGSGTVGGGDTNLVYMLAEWGTIGGGMSNVVTDTCGTVAGGSNNYANAAFAFAGGGFLNDADARYATIGGGDSNYVGGNYATIPGGLENTANGARSLAAGWKARALHDGTFVWADNLGIDLSSTAGNQFLIRASGGVGIRTNTPQTLVHIGGNNTDVGAFPVYEAPTSTNGVTPLADPNRQGLLFNAYTRDVDGYRRYADIVSLGYTNYSFGGSAIRFLTNARLDLSGIAAERMRIEENGDVGIATSNPNSKLHVNGTIATRAERVTSTPVGPIVDTSVVFADASGGAISISLPAANTCAGRQYTIKKVDATANVVTIAPAPGNLIESGVPANYPLANQYDFVVLVSDGVSHYYVVGM